jgi:hypothetical protein
MSMMSGMFQNGTNHWKAASGCSTMQQGLLGLLLQPVRGPEAERATPGHLRTYQTFLPLFGIMTQGMKL